MILTAVSVIPDDRHSMVCGEYIASFFVLVKLLQERLGPTDDVVNHFYVVHVFLQTNLDHFNWVLIREYRRVRSV